MLTIMDDLLYSLHIYNISSAKLRDASFVTPEEKNCSSHDIASDNVCYFSGGEICMCGDTESYTVVAAG